MSGNVLKASIQKLTKVADAIAESQRPGGALLTATDRGGLALAMASAGLTVKGLGPTQSRLGVLIHADAKHLLDGGARLDQVVNHLEDGISALRGRLRHTPVD
ncbi:MAG: hypothetical protein H7287_02845 [Thermoleophilia bacterium]|nr:hypothetical protein [Thermoleophilia bacterium]